MSRKKKELTIEQQQDRIFSLIRNFEKDNRSKVVGIIVSNHTYCDIMSSGYHQSICNIDYNSGDIRYMGLILVRNDSLPEYSLVVSGA